MNNYSYVQIRIGGEIMNHSDHHDCCSHHATASCTCNSHAHTDCGCSGKHEHKIAYARFLLGIILFLISFFPVPASDFLLLAAYLLFGYDVLISAFRGLFRKNIFDESFLMAIATIGAILIGEYHEAVGVMLFYQIGEFFQHLATKRSEKSISSLMDIRPDFAYRIINGQRIKTPAEEILVGEEISVAPGERIPSDGIILDGTGFLDTSCLTGESRPRRVCPGDTVQSGAINTQSHLRIRVTKPFSESTASKILELMHHASEKKTHSERFITTFSKIYTPVVVLLALCLAILPPLFGFGAFSDWLYRALIFLVVSCPCALVLSVPLGFFAGIGCASRHGIIFKGSEALEKMKKVNAIVFDKTGTLTQGVFEVTKISSSIDTSAFLELCAYAEYYSQHPIAQAVKKAYAGNIYSEQLLDYREISGKGVRVLLNGQLLLAGNEKLMQDYQLTPAEPEEDGSVVHLAKNGEYLGFLLVSDRLRPESKPMLRTLASKKIHTAMLTGDRHEAARQVADALGIRSFYAELLPQDKAGKMQEISKTYTAAFLGDGINDAPVIAGADLGIAMGAIGSDAAIEAADVVLMTDNLEKIPQAIEISAQTIKIVKQNIIFPIVIKILVMLAGALGFASMWWAIFADVGVSLLAVLNALRALSYQAKK